MKRAILGLVVVTVMGIHAPTVVAEAEEVGLPALGKRFVESLEDDNFVAYAQCWVAASIWRDECASVDRLTEVDIAQMKTQYAYRDRVIPASFKLLQAELDKLADDTSRISLESISTERFEEHLNKYGNTVRKIRVALIIRIDADTLVRIDAKRSAEIGDLWYFVGLPSNRMRVIQLNDAQEEESSRSIRFDFPPEDGAE